MIRGACSETLAWEQKKADSDLFETSGEAASVNYRTESRNPETFENSSPKSPENPNIPNHDSGR